MIDFKKYNKFIRTTRKYNNISDSDTEALLGLFSEIGEVADVLRDRKVSTRLQLLEEVGDVLYYLSIILSRNGFTIPDAVKFNVEKLVKRKGLERTKLQETIYFTIDEK